MYIKLLVTGTKCKGDDWYIATTACFFVDSSIHKSQALRVVITAFLSTFLFVSSHEDWWYLSLDSAL